MTPWNAQTYDIEVFFMDRPRHLAEADGRLTVALGGEDTDAEFFDESNPVDFSLADLRAVSSELARCWRDCWLETLNAATDNRPPSIVLAPASMPHLTDNSPTSSPP